MKTRYDYLTDMATINSHVNCYQKLLDQSKPNAIPTNYWEHKKDIWLRCQLYWMRKFNQISERIKY